MKLNNTHRKYMNISMTLSLLFGALATVPAYAQDAMSFGADSGLGLDQDSLLPPEVVPLDANAASQMTKSQALSRQANMASGLGSMQPLTPPGEMQQSAQNFRKDMYNSLYNQGTLAPAQNQVQNQGQGWSGGQNQMSQNQSQFNGQMGQGQMGGMPPQQQPTQQLSQSPWMGGQAAMQQQTLSGTVKNPGNAPNSKFNGLKHVLGTATGFGGGMMTGMLMMRNGNSSPAAMLGMGMFGSSILNYGARNAFRGF